jgi:hypothetical protein
VLNSLTEHGFQDAFTKWPRWERCIRVEGGSFEVMLASSTKLVIEQMAAPVPGIMDGSLQLDLFSITGPKLN